MTSWDLILWGIFGGFLVDGLELYRVVKNNGGVWPADCRSPAFVVAEIIRLACGGGLALALGLGGQISGPVGAVVVGVVCPLLVEKMAKQLPKLDEVE